MKLIREFFSTSEFCEFFTCFGGKVLYDVALSDLSHWEIGGVADCIIRPTNTKEVASLIKLFRMHNMPYVVIGATSNLLFADEGLRVPCIQIGNEMSEMHIDGGNVSVQAGAWVPSVSRKVMQAGLSGAEHICGIPGTLGGLICMNGGSQRNGIGSSVINIESVDKYGRVKNRSAKQCCFSYRDSVYQYNKDIITSAILKFNVGNKKSILSDMLSILSERKKKFPRKQPNCGSVFKSNPAIYSDIGPPGAVIEKLGFKGKKVGGAIVSQHHANFIVNEGNARASDVLALIREISDAIFDHTGHRMDVEARYVSPDGIVSYADKV